jgi:hypothetical protein
MREAMSNVSLVSGFGISITPTSVARDAAVACAAAGLANAQRRKALVAALIAALMRICKRIIQTNKYGSNASTYIYLSGISSN